MFAPGSIIVVTEKPEVTYVTVRETVGPIRGMGWLVLTNEGNYVLVDTTGDHPYLSRLVFLIDKYAIFQYLNIAKSNA